MFHPSLLQRYIIVSFDSGAPIKRFTLSSSEHATEWYISRAQRPLSRSWKGSFQSWRKRSYFPRVKSRRSTFPSSSGDEEEKETSRGEGRDKEENGGREEEGGERERERIEGHDLRTGVYHRWGIYFGAVITTCPSLSSLFLANNELQPFRRRERRGECRGGRRPVAYPGLRVGVIANVITHVAQTSPCFTLSYVHADRGCDPRIIPLPLSSTVFEDDRIER